MGGHDFVHSTSSPRTWGCFTNGGRYETPKRCLPHARGGVSRLCKGGISAYPSSPRTWGCFSIEAHKQDGTYSLPHARGGVSSVCPPIAAALASSPRTWGCFFGTNWRTSQPIVFPTHVGVFLTVLFLASSRVCLPHARGGVSGSASCLPMPRLVFPTHVGVFPPSAWYLPSAKSLPHARGGVSKTPFHDVHSLRSSPRTWGCFPARGDAHRGHPVFPTHVGVFPCISEISLLAHGRPHARGGVSVDICVCKPYAESSPRTWGCFPELDGRAVGVGVFPTHVGVFPERITYLLP